MTALSKLFTGLGRYIIRQGTAIIFALAALAGGALCVLLGAAIGIILVAVFSIFLLISPLVGWSLKKGIDGLADELEKVTERVKASNATDFPRKGA